MIGLLKVNCAHRGEEGSEPRASRRRKAGSSSAGAQPSGCGWTGKLEGLTHHLESECNFADIKCQNKGGCACPQRRRRPDAKAAAAAAAAVAALTPKPPRLLPPSSSAPPPLAGTTTSPAVPRCPAGMLQRIKPSASTA